MHGGTSRTPGPAVSLGTVTATALCHRANQCLSHRRLHREGAGGPPCHETPCQAKGSKRGDAPRRRLCRCPEHPQSVPSHPQPALGIPALL